MKRSFKTSHYTSKCKIINYCIFISAYPRCANDPNCARQSAINYLTRFAQVRYNKIYQPRTGGIFGISIITGICKTPISRITGNWKYHYIKDSVITENTGYRLSPNRDISKFITKTTIFQFPPWIIYCCIRIVLSIYLLNFIRLR